MGRDFRDVKLYERDPSRSQKTLRVDLKYCPICCGHVPKKDKHPQTGQTVDHDQLPAHQYLETIARKPR